MHIAVFVDIGLAQVLAPALGLAIGGQVVGMDASHPGADVGQPRRRIDGAHHLDCVAAPAAHGTAGEAVTVVARRALIDHDVVHVLQQRFDAPELRPPRDRRRMPADAQMHEARRAGQRILAGQRRGLRFEEGKDLAAVGGLRPLDQRGPQFQVGHRVQDRFVRHRGGGRRDALQGVGSPATGEQDRLLVQAGDGDGGMCDAVDRAQPVADQLQLGVEFRAARKLARELGEISHPLHRALAHRPDSLQSSENSAPG
jgi:hypothetical protein